MSVKGARRTKCSGTKRFMCTNIRMKLIMTRVWSPLRIIENESILAHVGGALRWPLKMRLIETNWVLFSLCSMESLRMRPFEPVGALFACTERLIYIYEYIYPIYILYIYISYIYIYVVLINSTYIIFYKAGWFSHCSIDYMSCFIFWLDGVSYLILFEWVAPNIDRQ